MWVLPVVQARGLGVRSGMRYGMCMDVCCAMRCFTFCNVACASCCVPYFFTCCNWASWSQGDALQRSAVVSVCTVARTLSCVGTLGTRLARYCIRVSFGNCLYLACIPISGMSLNVLVARLVCNRSGCEPYRFCYSMRSSSTSSLSLMTLSIASWGTPFDCSSNFMRPDCSPCLTPMRLSLSREGGQLLVHRVFPACCESMWKRSLF